VVWRRILGTLLYGVVPAVAAGRAGPGRVLEGPVEMTEEQIRTWVEAEKAVKEGTVRDRRQLGHVEFISGPSRGTAPKRDAREVTSGEVVCPNEAPPAERLRLVLEFIAHEGGAAAAE